jgi:hypothetical protein
MNSDTYATELENECITIICANNKIRWRQVFLRVLGLDTAKHHDPNSNKCAQNKVFHA